MNTNTNISPLEQALEKRLAKLQPKTKSPGFLRSVIERQSVRIDGALAMGYSYDEVAEIFSELGIKCKGSTLKRYHLQGKKKLEKSSPIPELPEGKDSKETKGSQPTRKKSF